jgi:hypothetical protein
MNTSKRNLGIFSVLFAGIIACGEQEQKNNEISEEDVGTFTAETLAAEVDVNAKQKNVILRIGDMQSAGTVKVQWELTLKSEEGFTNVAKSATEANDIVSVKNGAIIFSAQTAPNRDSLKFSSPVGARIFISGTAEDMKSGKKENIKAVLTIGEDKAVYMKLFDNKVDLILTDGKPTRPGIVKPLEVLLKQLKFKPKAGKASSRVLALNNPDDKAKNLSFQMAGGKGAFAVSDLLGSCWSKRIIGAKSSCTLKVVFKPSDVGEYESELKISSSLVGFQRKQLGFENLDVNKVKFIGKALAGVKDEYQVDEEAEETTPPEQKPEAPVGKIKAPESVQFLGAVHGGASLPLSVTIERENSAGESFDIEWSLPAKVKVVGKGANCSQISAKPSVVCTLTLQYFPKTVEIMFEKLVVSFKERAYGKVESVSIGLQGDGKFSGVDSIAPVIPGNIVTRNKCMPMSLVMWNEAKQQVAKNPFNRPMPIALTASAGTKLYSDAGCSLETSRVAMPADQTQMTIWLIASEGAQLTISAKMDINAEK